ncbi:MAG: kinase/pyrophosphorylase, partial [Coriobacteriales bacterium]|nr:kinase/pyrophosphorylase [Coriobacteriales bacterium]
MNSLHVFIVSDSLGDTAAALAAAAVSQFPQADVDVTRIIKVTRLDQVIEVVRPRLEAGESCCVFHTLVDPALRDELGIWAVGNGVQQVDLLGPALSSLSAVLHQEPVSQAGAIHEVSDDYFHRIEAMEFTVNHDDGRRPDELHLADIVLLGVSRTSKTPLSLVLAQRGYRVANVTLALGV